MTTATAPNPAAPAANQITIGQLAELGIGFVFAKLIVAVAALPPGTLIDPAIDALPPVAKAEALMENAVKWEVGVPNAFSSNTWPSIVLGIFSSQDAGNLSAGLVNLAHLGTGLAAGGTAQTTQSLTALLSTLTAAAAGLAAGSPQLAAFTAAIAGIQGLIGIAAPAAVGGVTGTIPAAGS